MSAPMLPGSDSGRSWISKPENKTTAIFLALLAAGVIWFWGLIVPFVLSAAEDTLQLVIVVGVLLAIMYVTTSKKIRLLLRLINRWITGMFVAIDPIGIRKNHIEETERKKSELEQSTGEIRGLRLKLKKRLDDNNSAYNQSMKLLQQATAVLQGGADGDRLRMAQRTLASESKHSDGLSALITKQKAHMEHYDMVLNVLVRYGEVCDDFILDLKREVELQEQDLEESKGFNKGMKAAFGIFRGSGSDIEMDDMARAQIEQQYSQRMGEVENFLSLTKDVITKADFNDEAALTDVQNKLDKWTGQNSQMSMGKAGETKQQMIAAASGDTLPPANVPSEISIDRFFK